MKKYILLFITLFLVGVLAGVCGHRHFHHPQPVTIVRVDTVAIEKPVHDTAYVTRYVERLLPVVVHDTCTIRDTLMIQDSAIVRIPIETKVYHKTGAYYAEVRGFEPELFYIEVYPKTEYVINEVPKVPRFSFGVQAGYGVSGQGLHPYIGLGVTYNLIGF